LVRLSLKFLIWSAKSDRERRLFEGCQHHFSAETRIGIITEAHI